MDEKQCQQLEDAVAEIRKRAPSRRKGIWMGAIIGCIAYFFAMATINDGKGEGGFFAIPMIILASFGFAWISSVIGDILLAQIIPLNRIWQRFKYPALLVVPIPFVIVYFGVELGIEKEVMTFDQGRRNMVSEWILAPLFFMVIFPVVNIFVPPLQKIKEG